MHCFLLLHHCNFFFTLLLLEIRDYPLLYHCCLLLRHYCTLLTVIVSAPLHRLLLHGFYSLLQVNWVINTCYNTVIGLLLLITM